MKYIRKCVVFFLLCVLLLTLPLGAAAADTASGKCGEKLTWKLNLETGMLTISGTGAMEDYTRLKESPWMQYNNRITGITVKSGVTTIGDLAFMWAGSNKEISSVSLPGTLQSIGDSAFASSKISRITIPASVKEIGKDAFQSCSKLKKIAVSSNNDTYCSDSKGVLYNKEKTELIAFPAGYKGSYTFPGTVKTIDKYACMYIKGLTAVTLSRGVQEIGEAAFMGCSALKTVNLPDTLTSIGKEAFSYCDSLETMKFSKGLESIGGMAFFWCSGLETVKFYGNAPAIGDDAFGLVKATAYYGKNNTTWTEEVQQNYGGSITWKARGITIREQPESVSAAAGKKATVKVTATGEGLNYCWYYANAGTTDYSKSSVTADTYSVTMNESRSGRRVYCLITDSYGNEAKTDIVELSLLQPVKITAQPVSVTVAEGELAEVTVTAEGTGLKYQWYYANAGKSSFSKASVTGNSYSVVMNESREGRRVYCVITDSLGNKVKTKTVTLDMVTELKILSQPESARVAEGRKATVSVKVQGDGLKYQWYYANPGETEYSKANVTGRTYSVTMNASRNGRQLYCVITDAYGNSVTTNIVSIRMK